MTEYADRDIIGLRDYYTKHVMAITAEGLHSKDDIAAELAYRDEKIAQLEARIEELQSDKWALEKQIDYLLENGCEPGSGVALIIEKRPDLVGVKE